MNSPKVSILIPVYNTAQSLPRCLDGVLAQSLKEIELIAVSDDAPDGETFVPFFRKPDKLFRVSLPKKPRKRIAKWPAKCYNKLTRNA